MNKAKLPSHILMIKIVSLFENPEINQFAKLFNYISNHYSI